MADQMNQCLKVFPILRSRFVIPIPVFAGRIGLPEINRSIWDLGDP